MTDPASPASPCTGLCQLDPAKQHCLGCQRSLAEIAAWPDATVPARYAILAAAAERQRRSTAVAPSVQTQRADAAELSLPAGTRLSPQGRRRPRPGLP